MIVEQELTSCLTDEVAQALGVPTRPEIDRRLAEMYSAHSTRWHDFGVAVRPDLIQCDIGNVDVFRRLEGKFGRFVSIWHPDLLHLDVHRACYFFAYACVPERRVIALLVSRQDFYPPSSVEVLAHIGRRAV